MRKECKRKTIHLPKIAAKEGLTLNQGLAYATAEKLTHS
jgi:hypothetical protein